jgi:hypothetical protein
MKNPTQNLAFKGSPENQTFIDNLKFSGSKQHNEQGVLSCKGEEFESYYQVLC